MTKKRSKGHHENSGQGDHPEDKKNVDAKREERNAREKDRSFRIAQQIEDLRGLLSVGGVIVPKGTKSSILTEAANYIRMLQQTQGQAEMERHQLIQQMQVVGSGALGPLAAKAIRHAAAQNGVWSLGNFGGPPPPTAVVSEAHIQTVAPPAPVTDVRQVGKIELEQYKDIFESSSVAMAVASMGGSIVDANDLFCRLAGYKREELKSMTIFNLTARSDLYNAFDRISAMIEGAAALPDNSSAALNPIILQGTTKNQTKEMGLSISLIRDEEKEGVLKCFCVTLLESVPPPGTRWPKLATVAALNCAEQQLQAVPQQFQSHEIPLPPQEMYSATSNNHMIKMPHAPGGVGPIPTYTTG
jgi:PAS domain-containing protein